MFSKKKNHQTDNYRNSSSFKSNKSRAEQPLANIMVWGAARENVSEKNPVGEKQTGNLGRNWAQAHKVILLGYIHEKNYEMRQIGVSLEWLPTCKRRVIILGTFTKGPRPTPCCSRAADIFLFLFKINIFRLIRQHLNARNSISFVTIMAKKYKKRNSYL